MIRARGAAPSRPPGTATPRPASTAVPPAPPPTTMRDVRARQREEYGGINWGAAFFGWLVAVGVAVLLTGLLAAAGAAIGLTESADGAPRPRRCRSRGAIALLAVLAIAYYCGGYVAGRMSRFDGATPGHRRLGRRAADHDRRRDPRRHRRVGVQRRRARQPAAPADRRRDADHRRRARHAGDRGSGRCCSPPSAASPAPATTARSIARASWTERVQSRSFALLRVRQP